MFSRQRETGAGAVIEHRACPRECGVARRAVLGETRSSVVRVRGPLIFLQVAIGTCRAKVREHVVGVARGAGGRRMLARKREPG